MAKEYSTSVATDTDIDQVIINVGRDLVGAVEVRLRCNVSVELTNKLDANDKQRINVPVNRTIQQLGVTSSVATIRNAILNYVNTQI